MKYKLPTMAAFGAVLFSFAVNAQEYAEPVFEERFINNTGTRADVDTIGWSALLLDPMHADPTLAIDVTKGENHPTAYVGGVSGQTGYEVDFDPNTDTGYYFIWSGGKETSTVITTPFNLDRSVSEITRFSWVQNTSAAIEDAVSVMVKIGGSWYVSAAMYDTIGEEFEVYTAKEHTFTTTGSDWHHITAAVGEPLEIGDPVSGSLPSGDIEAVGLHVNRVAADGAVSVDEFQIWAEPASDSSATWANYPIVETGGIAYVNTEDWLGWLAVTDSPWIYSESLQSWIYLTEASAASPGGAWTYVLK